ncbi:MAG: hypothetical protein GY803_21790 [Chloroflexi bacterium]|nr:hypothetical protein [Chloroflexota bacterium]
MSEYIKKQPVVSVIVGLVIGLILGLVYAWVIDPVEYTGAGIRDLEPAQQEIVIRNIAELYSYQGDRQKVQQALGGWGGDVVACRLAATVADPADAARLEAVAAIVNEQGCAGVDVAAPAAETEGGGSSFGTILLLGLLLLFLAAAIVFVINRRNALAADDEGMPGYAEEFDAAPVTGDDGVVTTPLARFRTTYSFGHDSYDDSFSIENTGGDFLGECGVGIAESIGADSPKNVTALEVWLFDKNDIRTITKVVMSDHAFFDEALKAKLEPKGEPVLAREGETIVLETASLIINAEVKDMQYGTGTLPPQSFFEQVTLELSAWAKEGDHEPPDIAGRVDEIMNY